MKKNIKMEIDEKHLHIIRFALEQLMDNKPEFNQVAQAANEALPDFGESFTFETKEDNL